MININNIDFKENIDKIKLHNGLTLIIDQIANLHSTCIGFFLKKGSRDENKNQLGYSHFSEHMLFKGTKKYDQKYISNFFDKVGGYINAYTTHELIVLYNRIPNLYFEKTTELMYEIFNDSIFNENEFITEKNVIINEIHSDFEDTQEKAHEYFMENLFPEQSLGLPIIGNDESIKNCKRDDLFEFYNNFYNQDDLLVVISGNIERQKIISLFENFKIRKNGMNFKLNKAFQGEKKIFNNILPSEQLHIVIGTSKFELDKVNFIKIGLLNLILGESMSSKFFQKIREELGLCYSIYTFFNKYREENIFGLYVSIIPKNIDKTISAISNVIINLIKNGITFKELEDAKTQKICELTLNYDILQRRIQRLANMDITYNKIFTLNEIIKIIQNTTLEDLNDLIGNIFIKKNFITQTLYKKEIKIGELEF